MDSCEIEIPVSWGRISVKAWGNPANEAVIMLHGFLDNAGSFDTLIPLLPANFYYLCVDLPGHGFSSHFPSNLPIHFLHFLYAVKIVTQHFKREKYTFISHSFGGRVSVVFAQIYPELVSKIALLDVGYVSTNSPDRFVQSIQNSFDILEKTLSFDPKSTPSYTYEEVVNRLKDNRLLGELTYEAAEQLARRMTKKIGDDEYTMTFDRKLRGTIHPSFSREFVNEFLKKYPIKCPAISIITTHTKELLHKRARSFLYIPRFKFYEVEGHHHSHHTNPELFAPILTKFLLQRRHKL